MCYRWQNDTTLNTTILHYGHGNDVPLLDSTMKVYHLQRDGWITE
ncbi:hypothetical protein [Chitinophaga sp. HK235]|nr:hypothetical protein [Chitinophaga sp. HK235]